MCADSSRGKKLLKSHNLFGPCAQIGQLFEIFLNKALITCPLSIIKPPPITFEEIENQFNEQVPIVLHIGIGTLKSSI